MLPHSSLVLRRTGRPCSSARPAGPTPIRRRPAARPQLESLEGRSLLSLTPAVPFATGTAPSAVVTADFNNDGRLDLATADSGSSTVSVLLGRGDGTFAAARHFAVSAAYALEVGDFNGDGRADLVSRYSFGAYDVVGGWVEVLMGNGDGTLQPAREAPLAPPSGADSYAPTAVAVADVDGDGRSDLGIDVFYTYFDYSLYGLASGSIFEVMLGAADGTFHWRAGGPEDFPVPAAPDLNADGHGDTVRAVYNGVSVGLGRADGTSAPEMLFPAGLSPSSVTAGDFNGDGRTDVAAANGGSDDVSVLLNDGAWPAADAPTVRVDNVVVREGNTGTTAAVFTISLSAASNQTITIAYRTSDDTATAGSDYQSASGTVTFLPGETRKAVAVVVKGDRVGEPDEYFKLDLDPPSNAVLDSPFVWCRIEDDEPRVVIGDASAKEGRKGNTLMTFTVTLSSAYDAPVTVNFATRDGTATVRDGDYVAGSGTLTFAPGQMTKTITIKIIGDRKKEANETFFVDLSGVVGAWPDDGQGPGTIVNDDK